MTYSLAGEWQVVWKDGRQAQMRLPGTLDENQIGEAETKAKQWHPDVNLENTFAGSEGDTVIATRFTRKYTYEGEARLTRQISWAQPKGKRVFLEAERARCLRLFIDGKEVPHWESPSLSTPHVFEVTGLLNGSHEIQLWSDNTYPNLPYEDITCSSAATDETQTNWNGVIGELGLRMEEEVFLSAIRVYPKGTTVTVQVEIDAGKPYQGKLSLCSKAFAETIEKEITVETGRSTFSYSGIVLSEGVKRWDEYEGNLYTLTACLEKESSEKTTFSEKTISFGIRTFTQKKNPNGKERFALNDRIFFLRSEANCGCFPEEGHPPMTKKAWKDILATYQSYGINCVRFHSWCPPRVAFEAADEMGMLMQPELSHWNPRNALETDESFAYYRTELEQIIKKYANHPSFVMLTLGNELHAGELGHKRMDALLQMAHELDDTRMYANGSNVHYGALGCDEASDFFTAMNYKQYQMRGTFSGEYGSDGILGYINRQYPNAKTNFDTVMKEIRKTYEKPVFSFEVGQFEILPDFDELEVFCGISKPANLQLVQKKVREHGLESVWKQYVEATGELSKIGYREEIEAVLRTEGYSGISLLGLQDFPGQGTALVGMLNSHLQPKPFAFAKPEQFHAFFREQLPLVLLPKYTFESGETLCAEIQIANYGKEAITGSLEYAWVTKPKNGEQVCEDSQNIVWNCLEQEVSCPVGTLAKVGVLEYSFETIFSPIALELHIRVGEVKNQYPIWVYPSVNPVCPADIYETETLDETAKEILRNGGKVYLTPPSTKEALPSSVRAQFTSDFWSVGTFPAQEGAMGQLIDVKHPLFQDFPTEFHTNWQWWAMATQRALILPKPYEAIITEMDSYAFMRPMAQLLEVQCENGKLLISSMGLQNLKQYPEVRALLSSIYRYMSSDDFLPKQTMELDLVTALVK